MTKEIFIAILLCAMGAISAVAQELAMPSGTNLVLEKRSGPDSYALPVAAYQDGRLPAEVFEGNVVAQVWRLDGQGLTTLQFLTPLREQIRQAGFDIRFDCETTTCGGFDFRFNTRVLPGPEMYVDLTNFRFVSASIAGEAAISVLISRSVSAAFVQVIRVGTATETEVITGGKALEVVQPDRPVGPFAQVLESRGRIVLEDLTFKTGASSLGDGRFESLETIAKYLSDNPGRKVAIVGHTDSTGGLDVNISVSRKRASSVLDRLVSEYDVNRKQLEAGGMGYLAPIISNLTEPGRQANRRVEAVLISTE